MSPLVQAGLKASPDSLATRFHGSPGALVSIYHIKIQNPFLIPTDNPEVTQGSDGWCDTAEKPGTVFLEKSVKRRGVGRQSLAETSRQQPGGLVCSVALTRSTRVTNGVREWLSDVTCVTVSKISKINLHLKTFRARKEAIKTFFRWGVGALMSPGTLSSKGVKYPNSQAWLQTEHCCCAAVPKALLVAPESRASPAASGPSVGALWSPGCR